MNLKRIFGFLLTMLGIAGLIYTAVVFTGTSGSNRDVKALIILAFLVLCFLCRALAWLRILRMRLRFGN